MLMTFVRLVTQGPISGTIESGYPISYSASFAALSRAQRAVVVLMNRSGCGVIANLLTLRTSPSLRFMSTTSGSTSCARESVAKFAECEIGYPLSIVPEIRS